MISTAWLRSPWESIVCILCSGACAHLSGYKEQSDVDVCIYMCVHM